MNKIRVFAVAGALAVALSACGVSYHGSAQAQQAWHMQDAWYQKYGLPVFHAIESDSGSAQWAKTAADARHGLAHQPPYLADQWNKTMRDTISAVAAIMAQDRAGAVRWQGIVANDAKVFVAQQDAIKNKAEG